MSGGPGRGRAVGVENAALFVQSGGDQPTGTDPAVEAKGEKGCAQGRNEPGVRTLGLLFGDRN